MSNCNCNCYSFSRTVVPTDIVNSVTIKLEPGLDQILDTETFITDSESQVESGDRETVSDPH